MAETILKTMTLEKKVKQLFVITLEQLTDDARLDKADTLVREAINIYPVGGIIFFARNLINAEQTTEMLKNIRDYYFTTSNIMPFLCVDEEGGETSRIARNPGFPEIKDVGFMADIKSKDDAYDAG